MGEREYPIVLREPDVLTGVRANQAYREAFLDRLNQAYAEDVISEEERAARAALAHRTGVTTDELRRLTADLPVLAKPVPHPSARVRVMGYIATGVISAVLMFISPWAILGLVPHHFSAATAAGAGLAAATFLALLIIAIFTALTDKVVDEEYG